MATKWNVLKPHQIGAHASRLFVLSMRVPASLQIELSTAYCKDAFAAPEGLHADATTARSGSQRLRQHPARGTSEPS